EVAAADFGVATLLGALPAVRRGETLVVVTGDHGESLGEHGESQHGILLYDSTLHVPLIVQGPGIAAGVAVSRQVRPVDLLPAIAELTGARAPASIDGVSLVPLLRRSDRHPVAIGRAPDRDRVAIRSRSDEHLVGIGSAPGADQVPSAESAMEAP